MAEEAAAGSSSSSSAAASQQLEGKKEEMAPVGTPIHRSSSRPQLDLSGAAIQGNCEERNPTILLPNQTDDISHFAVDLGGSLIKLVYFSRHAEATAGASRKISTRERIQRMTLGRRSYPILGGRLHFVKFETRKLNDCLDFIQSKKLHHFGQTANTWVLGESNGEGSIIKSCGILRSGFLASIFSKSGDDLRHTKAIQLEQGVIS